MEVTGRIKKVGETETFGSNGFRKRELVLTTEDQYPQVLAIEFVQDKTDLLDNFSIGQLVKISINLRGREWTNPEGKAVYFNSIQGWRIELSDPGDDQTSGEPSKANIETKKAVIEDDLPF